MRSNIITYRDVFCEAAVGILLKVVLGEDGRMEGRREGGRERHKEGGSERRKLGSSQFKKDSKFVHFKQSNTVRSLQFFTLNGHVLQMPIYCFEGNDMA